MTNPATPEDSGQTPPAPDNEGPPVLDSEGPPVLDSEGPPVLDSEGPPVLDSENPPAPDNEGPPAPAPRPGLRLRLAAFSQRRSVGLAAIALALALPALALFARVTLLGYTLVPYDALVADPVFRPLLEEAGVTAPHNDLVADLVLQNVVWKEHLTDALARGEAPLWNQRLAGGMPFAASGQMQPLFPTTLLFLTMPPDAAFGWTAFLNLWVAALAMYVFGRSLRLSRIAAVFMGLAWSCSLLFVANAVFPMIQAGMALTPLALASIESTARAVASSNSKKVLPTGRAACWLVVLAVSVALIGLAGHAEILYYALLTLAVYGVVRAITLPARRRERALLLAWLAGAGAAGVLLAGVQLVPFTEVARSSSRAGATSYDQAVAFAFGVRQLVTFLVPDFYGNPAHHAVRELGTGAVSTLANGTFWGFPVGAKNYVESAAYAGVLTAVMALFGLAGTRRARWFFAGLALLSLSFVFGMPTYRLLFETLPGFDQLRTPFRWIFPAALSIVALAGLGVDMLVKGARRRAGTAAKLLLAAAAVPAGVLVAARLRPESWSALVGDLLARSPQAQSAVMDTFGSASLFSSYLYWRAAHLAGFLLLASLAAVLLAAGGGWRKLGAGLALAALCADLLLVGAPFNPSVAPALGRLEPQVVKWLADAQATRFGRVMGFGEAKVLWPNSAMRFGIDDLRAYDSLIPAWVARGLSTIEPQDANLTYNRIGNLTEPESLDHPLLAALGGRYIVTTDEIEHPGVDLVFEGEAKVYSVEKALPRAWVVNEISVEPDPERLEAALDTFDPRRTVLLSGVAEEDIWKDRPSARAMEPVETRIVSSSTNGLVVDTFAPRSGMLVISDAWFPGWRAWVDYADRGEGERQEREVPVYQANLMMRAVPVPAGRSTVRLEYFPMSWKVGLYASFLGLLLLLMVAGYALWDRFVRLRGADEQGRLAVNTAGPMAAALLNKLVDFVFAMLMLRLLGPEGAGKYYTAITVIAFAEIFTNFGLNLFTTREVARSPSEAPRFLVQTSLLRLVLWVVAVPVLIAYVLYRAAAGSPLGPDTVLAMGLLMLALVPGNFNSALTSIFQGFERMMVPAGVSIFSNFLKVAIGAAVLLAGYGFVGLASVAIVVNWVTFAILTVLVVREGIRPAVSFRPEGLAVMAGLSLPFMLNHLLQTLFFKIDVLLLSQMSGDVVVGWYQVAYKWVDALLIIPGYLTMALFPMMSRQALNDRDGLRRSYIRAVRWLISLALPICLVTTFLATPLIRLLGGPEYLPAGATALSVMIWFLPFSFANGLAQYVLLATDRQKLVAPSFVVAVVFNITANLWAIPRYGFVGAAVVTILSEIALLFPFSYGLRDLGAPPLVMTIWRPALGAAVMGLVLALLGETGVNQFAAAAAGGAAYILALHLVGGITQEDRAILGRFAIRRREPDGTPV